MRVIVAAGGSGGHVYPAVAVLHELRRRGELTRAGWMGTPEGIEAEILKAHPWVSFLPLSGQGLPRGRPWCWPGALLAALWAVVQAVTILRTFRPHVVLGMGGYPAFAPVVAAALLRIPVVIHEQNARLGLVNRVLSRLADEVLVSFPQTEGVCGRKVNITGNPVREEIVALGKSRELGRELLVFGGSQGSRVLVDAALRAAPKLAQLPGLRLRLVVGRACDGGAVRRRLRDAGVADVEVVDYEPDMAAALDRARLVVARAGATTVAELAAAGRPAILVPWSGAAAGHQACNARALAQRKAGVILTDEELARRDLGGLVTRLWLDEARLAEMGDAAREVACPAAAQRVADAIVSVEGRGR